MQHLSVAVALLLFAATVSAEPIRCGSWVVDESVSVEELLRKCGEPAEKRSKVEDVWARNPDGSTRRVGTSVTEYWTYDRGPRAAPVRVTIVDGKIRSIERVF